MNFFRDSLARRKLVGLCLLLYGLALQSHRVVADDLKSGTEPDAKPLRAEKPEPDAPEPQPETPEERRKRIRYQAVHGMGSMTNLIGIPQIQHALNMSEEQQAQIADQTRKLHIYVRYEFLDVQRMPKHRQAAGMREMHVQTRPVIDKRQKEMLNVLTDEQRRRLLGISLQMRGPKGLLDEEVIELLGLTDDQVESILAILEEHDVNLRKLATKSPAATETPLIVIRPKNSRKDMIAQVEKQILEVLTEAQRKKFKDLQGEPYVAQPGGRLPTLIQPSEDDEQKTLKELVPEKQDK